MRKLLLVLSLLVVCVCSFAQNKTITGVVTGDDGAPVPGAAVMVKGTTNGTVTDFDGKYSINAPADAVLVFSFIGMENVEKNVDGQTKVDAMLASDSKEVEEVLVVAYGTQKKSSFTGSASQVSADDIKQHVSSNVVNALAGATPGVQYTTASGDPTSNTPTLKIRGIGSMNASTAPLYIVDGMPYDGPINAINPNDVASMTVLKDAAASAIYGARGANGVVLITTKKGRTADAEITVDAKWGSNSRLIPQYDVITDPGQYYELHFKQMYNSKFYNGASAAEAYEYACKNLYDEKNGGLGYQIFTVPEGENLIGTNLKLNPNATLGYTDGEYYYTPDDWYDEVFSNSFRQEYNVSASAASDRMNYYMSVGFLQDGGIVKNSDLKRYNARLNAEYQAKDWLRFNTNMSFSYQDSKKPSYSTTTYASSGNLFYICNNMGPIYPLYVRNADGTIKTEQGRTVYDSNQTNFSRPNVVGNAVRDNEYNFRQTYRDVFSGKWGAVITPIEGLSLTANVGAMFDNTRYNALYSPFGSASSVDGQVSTYHARTSGITSQYLASYTKTVADVHNFDILLGYEQYKETEQLIDASNDRLFSPTIGELDNTNGVKNKDLSSYTYRYMTEGFIGRLQYDYQSRYFLSGSFRRDASSHFAEGHRWGTFGSVGAAWMITNEEFLQDVDFLDELKFKASYGVQGNDAFDYNDDFVNFYPYADLYSTSYNEETGAYSTTLVHKGNENLTWETNHNFNVGFDFAFFKRRLNGTVEYFHRKTTDMLYDKPTPLSSGNVTGNIPTNVGDMKNYGFEISLDGSVFKTKDFEWALNFNLGHYTNEITDLDETVRESGIKGTYYIYRIGGTLSQAYYYKYAGVNKENGKALYYKKNDDGSVSTTENFSEATQFDCGTTLPKVYGGFGTSLNFKGIDLSASFSYQLGGKTYDGGYQNLMHTEKSQNVGGAWHKDALKAWSLENPNSDIPRLDGDGSVSQSSLDRFQVSSNFLCLNNVTLGYNLPKDLITKLGFSSFRVYVAGENLAVATARKGLDPRFNLGNGSFMYGSGSASNRYAALRTITGGLTFTF